MFLKFWSRVGLYIETNKVVAKQLFTSLLDTSLRRIVYCLCSCQENLLCRIDYQKDPFRKDQKHQWYMKTSPNWKPRHAFTYFLIFCRKKFSNEKYSIQKSTFFPFPDFAHNAQSSNLQNRWSPANHICEGGMVKRPTASAFESPYQSFIFQKIFRYNSTQSFFNCKNQLLWSLHHPTDSPKIPISTIVVDSFL